MWAPAAVVSPFNYVQLIGAAITGYLFFGEVPDVTLWLGTALIVGSGILMAWSEARRPGHRARRPVPERAWPASPPTPPGAS